MHVRQSRLDTNLDTLPEITSSDDPEPGYEPDPHAEAKSHDSRLACAYALLLLIADSAACQSEKFISPTGMLSALRSG